MLELLLTCLLCTAPADSVKPVVQDNDYVDRWVDVDKFQHMTMSYAVTAFAYGGARSMLDRDASLTAAVSAGVTAGVFKEFWDRARGRPFSFRDLAWDALGVAAGYITLRQTR